MHDASGGTGRLVTTLTPSARRILFDRELAAQIDQELPLIARIDCAHVLMLGERRLVPRDAAVALLRAIGRLRAQRFEPLRSRVPRRGLFLLYEQWLIETEGADVGGVLQTARSRNDLGATLVKLRLRPACLRLLDAALRLQAIVLRRAATYAATVMPAYTHGQPAEPITYGHYLAGLAEAFQRDIDGLLASTRQIDVCPLGAAAVAGTSVPIDPARTASLLGFRGSTPNSIDAVASRDLVLRLLAATAIHATTMSRAATDLLQWLTAEFQLLSLPDDLVGSSSAMPQKRNPFLLEHVQGRTASAVGALTAALSATRSAPFTNAIAVGTESVRPAWTALSDAADAATLLRLVLARATPNAERMWQRAAESFTNATAVAVRLTMEGGMSFRAAHTLVGGAVREAVARGLHSLEELAAVDAGRLARALEPMDRVSCVAGNRYGGGPAPGPLAAALASLRETWLQQRRQVREHASCWRVADERLDRAVEAFCDGNG
jgi:argininosuccinate lyase